MVAKIDLPAVLATLLLAGIGIFFIASSTDGDVQSQSLWRMQALWLIVAVVAAAIVVAVDYRVWCEIAFPLHAIVLVLLVAVLLFGKEVGGNRSWLVLGPVRLQPSELAKWTTCLALSSYLARRVREGVGTRELFEVGLIAGLPLVLIGMQPDLGTALTFVPIVIGALLMGGLRWRVVVVGGLLVLLTAPLGWIALENYHRERILTVIQPDRDPSGVGYQARQSKIAIGSGGLTGKGLYRGTQSQLNFLPAQHTDFIFAVIAEELGFAGSILMLGLFYLVLQRGIGAARSAQDRLGTYLAMLVVAWIAGQTTINIGMVLGRLPTIGVPLPFVSYGGSALVSAVCGVALIVNVRSRRFVN